MTKFKDIDKMVADEFYRSFPCAKKQILDSKKSYSDIRSWVRHLIEKQCSGITISGRRCKILFTVEGLCSLEQFIDGSSNRCDVHKAND